MLSKIPVPVRLSLVYFFFGALWIIFSGRIAERIAAGDSNHLQRIEQYKGMFFVIVSTALLFFLSRKMYHKIVLSLEEHKIMEKKNDALVTATKEGIYEYSIREDRVVFNTTMRQILGITNNEQVYDARKFWETHIHPDDIQRVLQQFDGAMKAGINYWREEYRARTVNGEYRNVLHSVYILKDDWGQAYGVIGAIQDLTEFRQLETQYHEQALKQKTELTRSIIQTEEKERNRWAEELHDNISQVLSVASLYTGTLKTPGTDVPAVADKIKEMLELSVQEIRQLSANLKPPRFEEQELNDAISLLIYYIKKVKVIDIGLEIDNEIEAKLDEDQKLMIYRIVQEQLNNILKHAEATAIRISIRLENGKANVQIKDNGKGFDPTQLKQGTGLKNIRSRLELFDGKMEALSAPGKGCELHALFQVE